MVQLRVISGDAPVNDWWDDGSNAIAFGREARAFVAINAGHRKVDAKLRTGMTQGTYCDIISGNIVGK